MENRGKEIKRAYVYYSIVNCRKFKRLRLLTMVVNNPTSKWGHVLVYIKRTN